MASCAPLRFTLQLNSHLSPASIPTSRALCPHHKQALLDCRRRSPQNPLQKVCLVVSRKEARNKVVDQGTGGGFLRSPARRDQDHDGAVAQLADVDGRTRSVLDVEHITVSSSDRPSPDNCAIAAAAEDQAPGDDAGDGGWRFGMTPELPRRSDLPGLRVRVQEREVLRAPIIEEICTAPAPHSATAVCV